MPQSLRYQIWMSQNLDQFVYLRRYSPYHNVSDEAEFLPSHTLYTSDSDSRVDPMHARKMDGARCEGGSSTRADFSGFELEAGTGRASL